MSEDRKPTSPYDADGGALAGGSTAGCPQCCGCVTSAAISNVRAFNDGTQFGHTFDFNIEMDFAAGPGDTNDCTLEWWERTNHPVVPGVKPGEWADVYAAYSTSETFDPWNNRKVPCPRGGHLSVTVTDVPGLSMRPGKTGKRILQFRLVVNSGGGCPCGTNSLRVTATQLLEILDGNPVDSGSFVTPSP